jgi:hypothetical protein
MRLGLGPALAPELEPTEGDASKHYVDTPTLQLIGRMHGSGWYARTSDISEMPRILLQDWKRECESPETPRYLVEPG